MNGEIDLGLGNISDLMNAESVIELELALIDPDPNQPRKTFDQEKLNELAENIADEGVIHPIEVQPLDNGRFMLVDGERRWRACKIANLSHVPALVRSHPKHKVLVRQVSANLHREGVDPMEEALAYKQMMADDPKLNNYEALGKKIRKSKGYISKVMSLLKLGPEAQRLYDEGVTTDREVLLSVNKMEGHNPDRAKEIVDAAVESRSISRADVREEVANEVIWAGFAESSASSAAKNEAANAGTEPGAEGGEGGLSAVGQEIRKEIGRKLNENADKKAEKAKSGEEKPARKARGSGEGTSFAAKDRVAVQVTVAQDSEHLAAFEKAVSEHGAGVLAFNEVHTDPTKAVVMFGKNEKMVFPVSDLRIHWVTKFTPAKPEKK